MKPTVGIKTSVVQSYLLLYKPANCLLWPATRRAIRLKMIGSDDLDDCIRSLGNLARQAAVMQLTLYGHAWVVFSKLKSPLARITLKMLHFYEQCLPLIQDSCVPAGVSRSMPRLCG